jgi:hypothetical protein
MRRWLAGLVVALAVPGCLGQGSGTDARPAPGPATTRPFCTARSTRAVVEGFFAAMAAGRVRDLDAFFVPVADFKWYSNGVPPGVRVGDRAQDRGSLLADLRQRQARHERIQVTWMHVGGGPVLYGLGNFGMKLRRTADDLPGGPQPLAGKGAVDCDSHKLLVLAIGRPY